MVGDRMKARSGGPVLIVEEIISDRQVACSWMDAMGQHKHATFALNSLEPITELAQRHFETTDGAHAHVSIRKLAARFRDRLHLA